MTAEAIRPTRRNLFVPLEEPVAAVTAAAVVSDDRREASQDKAWRMVLGFFLLTGGLIVAGGSPLVRYGYPAGSVILAFWLFRKAPVTYLSFVWWLSFLSPFIRRVVDYESGWHDPSPVLLAPSAGYSGVRRQLIGWLVSMEEVHYASFHPRLRKRCLRSYDWLTFTAGRSCSHSDTCLDRSAPAWFSRVHGIAKPEVRREVRRNPSADVPVGSAAHGCLWNLPISCRAALGPAMDCQLRTGYGGSA